MSNDKRSTRARVWEVGTWLFTTFYQTRGERVNGSRWLAMIDNYQKRSGGRDKLAKRDGSFSQRIAYRALAFGVRNAIISAIIGSLFYILHIGPRDSFGWRRGGIGKYEPGDKGPWWSWPDTKMVAEWPEFHFMDSGMMGRFERGGW